jgi:hypothetical protein
MNPEASYVTFCVETHHKRTYKSCKRKAQRIINLGTVWRLSGQVLAPTALPRRYSLQYTRDRILEWPQNRYGLCGKKYLAPTTPSL